LQLINPSTSPNELNTTLTPHSIIHGDACFAYFNKIWGIPAGMAHIGMLIAITEGVQQLNQYHANWISYRSACE
jgi:cell division protein FtsX